MKSILKNRIFIWVMYGVLFFFCGWFAFAIWTGIQLAKGYQEVKKEKKREYYKKNKISLREQLLSDPEIAKLNDPANMTETERKYAKIQPNMIKVRDGWRYVYENKS